MIEKERPSSTIVPDATDGARIRIPATYAALDTVVDAARERYAPLMSKKTLFDLLTALREALLNAVAHGCRQDSSLTVECELGIVRDMAVITVRDPGPGFDFRSIPPGPPSPEASAGRGLAIMNLLSRSTVYNEAGNEVTLTFTLGGQDGTMTAPDTAGSVISPEGDIVASMEEVFRERLARAAREHPEGLTIDLGCVNMIDSVGLGLLVAAHNTLTATGGCLTLVNVNEDLVSLLTAMRLHKHFVVNPGG